MGRSRYKIYEPTHPHFVTCTILHWLPIFTRQESTAIIIDTLKHIQQDDAFKLYTYVIFLVPSEDWWNERDEALFEAKLVKQLISMIWNNEYRAGEKFVEYGGNFLEEHPDYIAGRTVASAGITTSGSSVMNLNKKASAGFGLGNFGLLLTGTLHNKYLFIRQEGEIEVYDYRTFDLKEKVLSGEIDINKLVKAFAKAVIKGDN